jgi:hypothetical protein
VASRVTRESTRRGRLAGRYPLRQCSRAATIQVCNLRQNHRVPRKSKPALDESTPEKDAEPTSRLGLRHHHHVYVVELADQVWNEPRFRKANPDYRLGKPFVYVGMTGLDPDLRFDKHKARIQANQFVFRYGLRLLPALYEVYNPMPYESAREMEVELAIGLREAGYGVWQA